MSSYSEGLHFSTFITFNSWTAHIAISVLLDMSVFSRSLLHTSVCDGSTVYLSATDYKWSN